MKSYLLFICGIAAPILGCTDPFVVNDKTAQTAIRTSVSFDALECNSGCDLALESVTQPINGGKAVADLANNTFSYTAPNSVPLGGDDFFTYTMRATVPDTGATQTMTAQVAVSLTCDELFRINPKTGTVCLDSSILFDALEGNTGCGLQLRRVTQPINGGAVAVDAVNNVFVYTAPAAVPAAFTPASGSSTHVSSTHVPFTQVPSAQEPTVQGPTVQVPCPPIIPTPERLFVDHFNYTVEDEDEEEEEMSAPVTVTIESCEDLTVTPKFGTTEPGLCVVFDALEGNTGSLISLVGVTQPAVGSVTADLVNNAFTYQAPATFAPATAAFSYTLVDVAAVPASAEVAVAVVLLAA